MPDTEYLSRQFLLPSSKDDLVFLAERIIMISAIDYKYSQKTWHGQASKFMAFTKVRRCVIVIIEIESIQ
ncbi:MAG: hypothetical protein DDT24_00436 [Chloroflexi bacterium]|nr:hypothetical protein [Chloroflexota bacterium]MBT9165750.1 hypothetical protein [Chloroflexota bacterium]